MSRSLIFESADIPDEPKHLTINIITPTRNLKKQSTFNYTDSKVKHLNTSSVNKTINFSAQPYLQRSQVTPKRKVISPNGLVYSKIPENDSYYYPDSEDFTITQFQEPQVARDRQLALPAIPLNNIHRNPIFTNRDSNFRRKIYSINAARREQPKSDIYDPVAFFHSYLLYEQDLSNSKIFFC